jgi:Zn-dependent protease
MPASPSLPLPSLAQSALFFVILLCSLALHEFAHAWVADKRGDPLPRSQGRVTLDPFAHLDPIGSFLIPGVMILLPVLTGGALPLVLIGWGKPVQISLPNPKTRRIDDILITLAGPGMNVALAAAAAVATGFAMRFGVPFESNAILSFALPVLALNVALAVFNLVPIPPLDGSHLLRHATGMSDETYARLAANGFWVLLVLINIPLFSDVLQRAILLVRDPFFRVIITLASPPS